MSMSSGLYNPETDTSIAFSEATTNDGYDNIQPLDDLGLDASPTAHQRRTNPNTASSSTVSAVSPASMAPSALQQAATSSSSLDQPHLTFSPPSRATTRIGPGLRGAGGGAPTTTGGVAGNETAMSYTQLRDQLSALSPTATKKVDREEYVSGPSAGGGGGSETRQTSTAFSDGYRQLSLMDDLGLDSRQGSVIASSSGVVEQSSSSSAEPTEYAKLRAQIARMSLAQQQQQSMTSVSSSSIRDSTSLLQTLAQQQHHTGEGDTTSSSSSMALSSFALSDGGVVSSSSVGGVLGDIKSPNPKAPSGAVTMQANGGEVSSCGSVGTSPPVSTIRSTSEALPQEQEETSNQNVGVQQSQQSIAFSEISVMDDLGLDSASPLGSRQGTTASISGGGGIGGGGKPLAQLSPGLLSEPAASKVPLSFSQLRNQLDSNTKKGGSVNRGRVVKASPSPETSYHNPPALPGSCTLINNNESFASSVSAGGVAGAPLPPRGYSMSMQSDSVVLTTPLAGGTASNVSYTNYSPSSAGLRGGNGESSSSLATSASPSAERASRRSATVEDYDNVPVFDSVEFGFKPGALSGAVKPPSQQLPPTYPTPPPGSAASTQPPPVGSLDATRAGIDLSRVLSGSSQDITSSGLPPQGTAATTNNSGMVASSVDSSASWVNQLRMDELK